MPTSAATQLALLTQEIENNSTLSPDQKKNYLDVINSLNPLAKDNWIYRIVVSSLGLALILTVIGGILAALIGGQGTALPEGLVAIGSASVGALAGLLAPSPKG